MFAISSTGLRTLPFVDLARKCGPAYTLILNLMGNYCRELGQRDPDLIADRKIDYQPKTANWRLRHHIERFHLLEYLELAHTEKWPVFLVNVKVTLGVGYDIPTLLEALKQPGVTITNLPPPRRTDNGQQSSQPNKDPQEQGLPPFSTAAFQRYLVKFITADDITESVMI